MYARIYTVITYKYTCMVITASYSSQRDLLEISHHTYTLTPPTEISQHMHTHTTHAEPPQSGSHSHVLKGSLRATLQYTRLDDRDYQM